MYPTSSMGEKVGAILFGGEGAPIDVDAVLAHLRANLADFKLPQYIRVVDGPLPRNAGGKLLKGPLRRDTEWGDPVR